MRVAVIGANLLGTATAFYTRRALDDNRAVAESSGPEDEIVIFEKLERAGGNKFFTLSLGDTEVPSGTASGVDVSACPALATLLADAGIAQPPRYAPREWAVFDWDADAYKLAKLRSRVVATVANSAVLVLLLQVFALVTAVFFANMIKHVGRDAFVAVDKHDNRSINYLFVLWFTASASLGFGVLPVRWVLRFYNWLTFVFVVRIVAGITYGGHSLSVIATLTNQMKEHLSVILSQDAASSCITPGHLLSACGMGKYAKVSFTEFINTYNIQKGLLEDVVSPGLAQTYGDTNVAADTETNALACLLSMVAKCPVPSYMRSSAKYMGVEETKSLCPKLASLARAKIELRVEVTAVRTASRSKWALSGVSGGKDVDLGTFDAVVVAAMINPEYFVADAVDGNLGDVLALKPELGGHMTGRKHVNVARFLSLVKGKIRASYVRKGSAEGMATKTTVLKSVNCSEILRVGDDIWRVSTGEKPQRGSSVADSIFEDIETSLTTERTQRRYGCTPLRNLNGREAPAFILGTRFLYAAATDRFADDVNLDCLSARNTASFFKDGVATWK